jgi:hypothetical protein
MTLAGTFRPPPHEGLGVHGSPRSRRRQGSSTFSILERGARQSPLGGTTMRAASSSSGFRRVPQGFLKGPASRAPDGAAPCAAFHAARPAPSDYVSGGVERGRAAVRSPPHQAFRERGHPFRR